MQRGIGRQRVDSATSGTSNGPVYEEMDVLIVGAGFAGCYLIHHLRKHNFKVKIVEAGSELGGVWYWNRYPGARVDSHYPYYALSIPEVWKDWYWTEKYPGSAELRRYFAHMDRVLDIKKDTDLNTKVEAAEFDGSTNMWTVHYDNGKVVRTHFFIAAIGFSAKRHFPDWKGFENFKGTIHHSSFWPMDGVDVRGKKLAVIGTGATGVQITQECAKEIGDEGSITVFQRTPNIALPMRQGIISKEQQDHDKNDYEVVFKTRLKSLGGFPYYPRMDKAFAVSAEEREAYHESIWKDGGFGVLLANFYDTMLDERANREMYDFWVRKTRARITNPKARDLLAPLEPVHCFGGKRPSLEQNFYEQFNRPNIHIVSSRETPIKGVALNGIVTSDGKLHEADIIALATGFDAVTGGIKDIRLRGLDGELLTDHWKDATYTYLGTTISNYPNLFMLYGPQSPTAFSNGPSCVEPQADWILKVLLNMRDRNLTRINPKRDAELAWKQDVYDASVKSLRHHVDGWYNGGNIPGKIKEPMNYAGGLSTYIERLADAFDDGGFKGFSVE